MECAVSSNPAFCGELYINSRKRSQLQVQQVKMPVAAVCHDDAEAINCKYLVSSSALTRQDKQASGTPYVSFPFLSFILLDIYIVNKIW